jgi:hypothetical protein
MIFAGQNAKVNQCEFIDGKKNDDWENSRGKAAGGGNSGIVPNSRVRQCNCRTNVGFFLIPAVVDRRLECMALIVAIALAGNLIDAA